MIVTLLFFVSNNHVIRKTFIYFFIFNYLKKKITGNSFFKMILYFLKKLTMRNALKFFVRVCTAEKIEFFCGKIF